MTQGSGAAPGDLMQGKTVLVTGATGGIGKVTAASLVIQGAHVWVVGRNSAKTQATAQEIGAAGHFTADLSLRSHSNALAQQVSAQVKRLDVLINNAGALYPQRQESREGLEMTWALNHLGYFVLTLGLLPLLRQSAGRVVNVSSAAHAFGHLRWQDPEFRSGYSAWPAYNQSKLANILFTRELAYRERPYGVTANALHPGLVSSGFARQPGDKPDFLTLLTRPFAISTQQGAQTSIYLASSPEVEGVSGEYFDKRKVAQPAPHALDDAAAQRLWALSETYL